MKFRKFVKKGFTLVELVVVIAVIAILASVSVVTYLSVTKKANQSADRQVAYEMNNILRTTESLKKPSTMHEALETVSENGFSAQLMDTKTKTYEYAYTLKANRFVVLENEAVVYPDELKDTPKSEIWRFTESLTGLGEEYSYYLKGTGPLAGTYTVKTGLDVGDRTVEKLVYDRSDASSAKTVLIRTNGADSSLEIKGYVDSTDPTKGDIVNHYGSAGSLNVVKCATGSYHENGRVGFAEISTGRIVLEDSSNINHIHINKKADEDSFDTVIIKDNGAEALPEAITRDEIQLNANESKDVVTVVSTTGASETVKVYGSNAQGSTEKTDTQNTTIASDLGQLVLDNGSDSKALDDDAKEEAKAESIDVVAGEEVAEDPDAAKYVARIGTKGYESFNEAVHAAKPKEKIYLLKDFSITETIGELTDDGFINGLQNEVVLTKDITIIFEGASQLQFNEGGLINVNGHSLRLGATTENAGLFLVEIDQELQTEIDESGLYLTVIGNNIEYIQSATLSNFVRFSGTSWETSSQIGVGGADPVVGPGDPPPFIWG